MAVLDRENRWLKLLLHFIFFISGITTVLIGQVLPILSNKFKLNDLEAGFFFPSQFAGSLIGTYFTNRFGRRGKLVLASVLGSVLMVIGILLMNLDTFAACLTGFFVNGLGIGLTLPSINILILEINPSRSASALSVLNFFWGVGAIVSKPFVDLTAGPTNIFVTTLILAIPLLIAASILGIMPRKEEQKVGAATDDLDSSGVPIWSTPIAWAIALFNFIHVGFESGMGGWLTTYTDRLEGDAFLPLLSPTFLFFLFFVAGRGIAPLFFRILSENSMLLLSLLTILIGLGVTLTAENVLWLSVGSAISGLGTSSIFPTNVSRFSKTFGPEAMRRATPLFISGTLGATVVTWLIGFISNRTGDLRSGMFVLAFSILFLLVLQVVLMTSTGMRKPARQ
ncbi:MAG: MFS transporter [Blastocatellia bacterium]